MRIRGHMTKFKHLFECVDVLSVLSGCLRGVRKSLKIEQMFDF